MRYPKQLKTRRKIEALTGIKSSLDKIRSVIALVYLLYVANERKASVRYSIPEGSRIKIAPNLLNAIEGVLGRNNLGGTINGNPLVTNQYEPLYVGVTLLMKLGYLKMEGRQNTAERTGGVRYPKQLYFANNTLVLDLILQGFPDNIWKQSLYEWLQNNKASNNEFEERVCKFITTCTFLTQFKLRDNSNNELFFQTEGIYKALTESDEDVLYSDSHEFVGPTRIYNNVLKEGIEPWIGINKNVLNLKGNLNPDAESISQMLSTTLDIFSVKDDSSMSEDDIEDNYEEAMLGKRNNDYPLQQIYYGAPGTGKSNTIKREVDDQGKLNFRTTFHPDSDYSTFVGCYKPKMKRSTITKDGVTTTDEKIIYSFEPQAFTNAYVQAWKTQDDVYLIIEEINRGNCAQIFGDLFQLLDRKNGESEYPVDADSSLADYLQTALADSERDDIPTEVKNGTKLKLPSNLYLWATMNTSDQSLFPIDSAFKRRWEWKYIPIDTKKEQWSIAVDGENYSWTSFLEIVNERVLKATSSEDKQLGFYFCKAQNKVISAETFVSKVLFYLWNDVFKDYDEGDSIFKNLEGKQLSFSKFYNTDGSVNNTTVKELLTALGIEKTVNSDVSTSTTEEDEEDEDGNALSSIGKKYDKYSVNGIGKYGKNRLATESVRKYIELNPYMTADEVLRNWKSLGVIVPHFIESKEEYDARTDNSKRSYEIPCGDTIIYVAHNGYGSNGKVEELMNAVNNMDWGLALVKVTA